MAFADKVTAWLSLNETTGVRANLHTTGAAWDLAEVNGVGFQAGLQGNAADFDAANFEYLQCADGTKYQNKFNWTACLAVHNILGDGTTRDVFGKRGATADTREFLFSVNNAGISGEIVLNLFYSTTAFTSLVIDGSGLHSDANPGWDVLFVGRRSSPSDQLIYRANDGPIQTVAAPASVNASTATFKLASYLTSLTARFFNGGIDELVWCDDTLTSAEMDEYYNGGLIVSYDDIFAVAEPPLAPSALTATATAGTKIALAWVDNSDDETGFKVERSLDGAGGWSLINTTAANATSYTDTALTPGVTYYYRVAATNAEGDSAYTDIESATTLIGEGTVVLTDTRPTAVLTDTRPTVALTDTRPTVVFTEI